MGYEILKGTIKGVEIKEGTAYYTVEVGSQDSVNRKIAKNVRHGFQFDPSGGNAVYGEGTSVYISGIITPTGIQDGVILAAVRPHAGSMRPISSPLQSIYEKLKEDGGESSGAEGLTPGDIFQRRGDGVFKFAYNGMYKILSKLGLGWIMDPSGDKMHGYANNFEMTLGNYGTIRSEIDKESKTALLHFDFLNSVDQLDTNGSLITMDIGEVNRTGRIAFNIIDATDPTGKIFRNRISIDKDGRVGIMAKDVTLDISSDSNITKTAKITIDEDGQLKITVKDMTLNISSSNNTNAAEITIDENGNARLKTETFKLGKGEPNQSMVRGSAFSENYNGLIDIIKVVLPSAALQAAAENKKIHDGISPELSTTNKLD